MLWECSICEWPALLIVNAHFCVWFWNEVHGRVYLHTCIVVGRGWSRVQKAFHDTANNSCRVPLFFMNAVEIAFFVFLIKGTGVEGSVHWHMR